MVEKARNIGLFSCPNDEKSRWKTVDIFGQFFQCRGIRTQSQQKWTRHNCRKHGSRPMQRKKSGQIGKDKISIFIFQIENSIQIFEDRFVWYHETRDTAQSGLFLFPAEMKKTASKYIVEEEYEEVTF